MYSTTFFIFACTALVYTQSNYNSNANGLASNYGSSAANGVYKAQPREGPVGNYGQGYNKFYGSYYPSYGYYPYSWNYYNPYYWWYGNNNHHRPHHRVRRINFRQIMTEIIRCARVFDAAELAGRFSREYLRCRELLSELKFVNATEIIITQCKLNYTNQEYDATQQLNAATRLRDRKMRELERYESMNNDRYLNIINRLEQEIASLNTKIEALNVKISEAVSGYQTCEQLTSTGSTTTTTEAPTTTTESTITTTR
uniref:DUF148 domain-containing protein n=1 Tax=Strongyloides papillosus TaxID=174720 RepID=A0A0N5BY07_STREA